MNTNDTNPLLCDTSNGVCETTPGAQAVNQVPIDPVQYPVQIIYFTDPICSSCWGIEPQLRRLKLEYGHLVHIEYHMGGLLPDWSYNSGGISKPSDVAHHWDEVSGYYHMPIDGDVWLEDPLDSSYPPSIAFKAAQLQDEKKALVFLRRIREMVFLEKKNITRWEHIQSAATFAGLDTALLRTDYDGKAQVHFKNDLTLAASMGVRGFPTMFYRDSLGSQMMIYGVKPYQVFENALLTLYPNAEKKPFSTDPENLFTLYPTLTTREFAELSGKSDTDAEAVLNHLLSQNKLTVFRTKNGVLWGWNK